MAAIETSHQVTVQQTLTHPLPLPVCIRRILHACLALALLPLMAAAETGETRSPLATHPSPYLRAHASDPVQWQPLTEATLEQAMMLERPIFLSSGYTSCYWCYRLGKESFQDHTVGAILNKHFVPVILDSELEPEIDNVLQKFVGEKQGIGGWPLNVLLTPEGHPMAGFNYIDRDQLVDTLQQFLDYWHSSSTELEIAARRDYEALIAATDTTRRPDLLPDLAHGDLLLAFLDQASQAADTEHGGFGVNEKYPFAPQLLALLDILAINPEPQMAAFLGTTLTEMITGPMLDHLEGGMFRYSQSRDWAQPHFEQMLYTQAQMSTVLVRAGQLLGNPGFTAAAIRMQQAMTDNFQHPDGYYQAALSAVDGAGESGGYYRWRKPELEQLLGADQAQDLPLLPAGAGADTGSGMLPGPLGPALEPLRTRLLQQRAARKRPVDDKIILGWNGLVLSALAHGAAHSSALHKEAKRLADRLLALHAAGRLPRLINRPQEEAARFDDLVYLARGLFDWWQLSADDHALEAVKSLLSQAYEQYHGDRGWIRHAPRPLIGQPAAIALADSQLPSPSALWLTLAWAMAAAGGDTALLTAADDIGATWPREARDNAFFHATFIDALVTRKWLMATAGE